MANEGNRKTIEQLQKEVAESGLGLMSDQDLKDLFGDAGPDPATLQNTAPIPPAANPAGSQGNPAGNNPPATGAPEDVLESIPEEFRDKDVPTSLGKMTKSISDTRSTMDRQAKEIQELRDIVDTLRQPAQPAPAGNVNAGAAPGTEEDPDADIDDTMCLESPKSSIKKLAQREAARIAIAALTQYDTALRRERQIDEFRKTHTDFDNLRDDMSAIVKEYPQLNRDPNALPKIYEMARQRATKRIEALKGSLGVTTAPINEEEVISKAVDRIKAEIAKRRSASGTTSTGAVNPAQRVEAAPRQVPKSQDEEFFDELVSAGPATLRIE